MTIKGFIMKEKILAMLQKLASDTVITMSLPVVKNKVHSFNVTSVPKDAKSFLIWLVKDYLTGGGKLQNLYVWFIGSAFPVRVRSLNPQQKVISVDKVESTIKNPDFKTDYPFSDAFTTFVSPDKFKSIKMRQISEVEKEISDKSAMFETMKQFLTGKGLEDATKAFNAQIADLTERVIQLKADIADLNKTS
jgi:hypothetical protein